MPLDIFNKLIAPFFHAVSLAAATLAAVCVVFFACADAAYAAFQPDLSIRLGPEPDSAYVAPGMYEQSAAVQVKSQGVAPGVAAAYRIQLRNAGDSPDTFLLTGAGSGSGYTVQYLDESGTDRSADIAGTGFTTPVIAAGGSTVFTLLVTPGAQPSAVNFEVPVRAVSVSDPGKADAVKSATCNIGNVAAVILSSPPDLSGRPGNEVTYAYTVTNTGNTANTFSLSVAGSWPSGLYADDGAGGGIAGDGVRQGGEATLTASTGVLQPGGSYSFFLAVTILQSAVNSDHTDHLVTVAGTGASVSDRVATGAVAPALTLVDAVRNITRGGVFAPTAEAAPGDTLEYRLAVTSSGAESAGPVVVQSEVPAFTAMVPGSLVVTNSPTSGGGACSPVPCGEATESSGTISAYLGAGASSGTGGTLPVGKTLYLYFRVQVL